MRRFLCLCLLLYSALPVLSGNAAETQIYIEYKYQSDQIEPGSFGDSTQKLWRAGNRYMRLQEAPDPAEGIHGLIIVNSPDAYMINLYRMHGQHMVDPGPTYDVHAFVFSGKEDPRLRVLEMGYEFDYFGGEETKKQPNVLIDGVRFDCYIRSFDDFEIHMLALAGTRTPFLITLKRPDREFAVRYLKYETGGEVDYSLYELPEGVKLRPAP